MVSTAKIHSILIVEDNQDLVMGLQDLLHHDGYAVTAAGTIATALKLVRAHRFNAILLDLGLPDGDGLEVLKESQRLDPSLPVVIVTAHISTDRTVGSLAQGAYAYLTKPYDREELRHILRRAIGVNELTIKVERTERLLSQSEKRLELATQGSHDGFWDGRVLSDEPWNSPRTPVWWSPRVKTMLGYSDEEFPDVLESWSSRIHIEDRDRVFAALMAHIERRDPYDMEYRLLNKAGAYRWFHARGQAIWDETGQVTRMAGSLRDVTDRKHTEDALRQSEQLLSAVVNNTTAVVYVKYTDGRYQLINQRFEQLFQIARDQIVGHTDHEIFPKDIADAFRANDVMVLERNCAMEYEEYAPHPDGLHTYISIKFPLCDHTGRPYATCGISTDITERKRAETALRTSQQNLRQALQASKTGLWDWNTETNDVWLSREWKDQLGYEEGEVRDAFESWEMHLHPDDHHQAMSYVRTYLAQPVGDYHQEFRLRHKGGTYRWIEARASFVTEPDGRRVRLLGSHTDITERKRDEEMRKEMHLALVHAMPGISRLDSGGRYMAVNEIYAHALGFNPSELIGGGWHHTVSPAYQSHAEAAYATMLRKGTGEFEALAVRKDGSTFWKQVLMVKILDREGCYAGHHCFMRDISERKSIEHNLRSLTKQLHLALTSTKLGTWNWDIQTDHINWCSQVDRFLDLSERARPHTKYDWLALVYPEDRESMACAMRQVMDQPGAEASFEHRVMKSDGSIQWCAWIGEIMRDQDGKAVSILGTVHATDRGA